MDPTFLAAVLALSAAFAWGSGDFTNGLAARRVGPFHAILISYFVGLITLTIFALIQLEPLTSAVDLIWGALAGLFGLLGLVFLLRGFATGRMSIVAPVSAVLTAAIPVIFAGLTEGLPSALQLLGFLLALISIWMLSRREEAGNRPAGIGLAILAGLGFGLFFVTIDQVGEGAVFWPLVAGRLVSIVLMVALAFFTRRPMIPPQAPFGLLVLAGVLDAAGNFFFLIAIQIGRLDVASVLASLYPAVTAILALLIIKERMSRPQMLGVAMALLAIALITI